MDVARLSFPPAKATRTASLCTSVVGADEDDDDVKEDEDGAAASPADEDDEDEEDEDEDEDAAAADDDTDDDEGAGGRGIVARDSIDSIPALLSCAAQVSSSRALRSFPCFSNICREISCWIPPSWTSLKAMSAIERARDDLTTTFNKLPMTALSTRRPSVQKMRLENGENRGEGEVKKYDGLSRRRRWGRQTGLARRERRMGLVLKMKCKRKSSSFPHRI